MLRFIFEGKGVGETAGGWDLLILNLRVKSTLAVSLRFLQFKLLVAL